MNPYLKDVLRVEWLSEREQDDVVHEACNLQIAGDKRTFRDIVENLVFIRSITKTN